jgi:hypothetical protein
MGGVYIRQCLRVSNTRCVCLSAVITVVSTTCIDSHRILHVDFAQICRRLQKTAARRLTVFAQLAWPHGVNCLLRLQAYTAYVLLTHHCSVL